MTSYEDFPCVEAVTMVTDYFEGVLSPEERAVLERHLSWCDWCATYVDQLRGPSASRARSETKRFPLRSWTCCYRRTEMHGS